MKDRELLELAAKAYWGDEIDDVCSVKWSEEDQAIEYTHGENQDHNGYDTTLIWSPLTDDGDALRLAVKLGLDVCIDTPHENEPHTHVVGFLSEHTTEPFSAIEYHHSDPYAATRRAIVRAAAEIGRAEND